MTNANPPLTAAPRSLSSDLVRGRRKKDWSTTRPTIPTSRPRPTGNTNGASGRGTPDGTSAIRPGCVEIIQKVSRNVASARRGPISPLRHPIRMPSPMTRMTPRSMRFMGRRPLWPISPRNSMSRALRLVDHARTPVKAHDPDESLQRFWATLVDLDATICHGPSRRHEVKHQGVERLDVHCQDHIRVARLTLAGHEASFGDTDFEDQVGNPHLVGLVEAGRGLGIEDAAHRHEIGPRDHDVGLFR